MYTNLSLNTYSNLRSQGKNFNVGHNMLAIWIQVTESSHLENYRSQDWQDSHSYSKLNVYVRQMKSLIMCYFVAMLTFYISSCDLKHINFSLSGKCGCFLSPTLSCGTRKHSVCPCPSSMHPCFGHGYLTVIKWNPHFPLCNLHHWWYSKLWRRFNTAYWL